ncbi:glycoside hydrolase family 13 protein [Aneurinibacillus terranovensis]|uniref:glycoside hydrolase family 13 protein n=1 Tax=Aneurinibacillus terranovensis TaxID=278991 RepID=UPI0003F9034F|nr:alpha-glucosidase [Aneurinibacillus terranovensis]
MIVNKYWWKESVVYQIYPRSFMDSNGDGIGDLQGIISKLDYLKSLGIDVIWLSPVYQSPNDDNGYDISDYQEIMDEFGTMSDWEQLLADVHARGMKLIMDLVPNHTSDEHPWFIESRSSKDSPKRDWYIWRPGKNGKEPNNWESIFSGPAWKYDETTGEYYMHLFSARQPDLNWENPIVRHEIYNVMKWWLAKGIDGFRIDAITHIKKTAGLPDAANPEGKPYVPALEHHLNRPGIHDFLQEMKDEALSKYEAMTVGETPGVSPEDALEYVNEMTGKFNMVFQFELMEIDSGPGGKWDLKLWRLRDLKKVITRWQKGLEGKGWNSLYLENHDQPRSVSRFGDDHKYHKESAKMLATFFMMLQGTPYIYQGQEIGMTNVRFSSIDDYKDVEILNYYREALKEGKAGHDVMESIYSKGRDNARTPMQWDATQNAGFSSGTPWIKVNPNYGQINVQQQLQDPDSILHYYKRLIALRKQNPALIYGTYDLIAEENEKVYAYTRTFENETILVILNFTRETVPFELPDSLSNATAQVMIRNYQTDRSETIHSLILQPYEALVYRLN